ncbi:hypothetical protein [Flavobacterium ginsengiterrae]|uniref:Leucine rich repeat (LRR) protein n=1 Tax=Flavobacterium ginsengiterrae TaxID=871695 RepID=A0ABP7GRY3_9FLAO
MKSNIILIGIILFIAFVSNAQKSKIPQPKTNISKKENIVNLSQRINSYPFNKSSQIRIISYNLDFDNGNVTTNISADALSKNNDVNNITTLEFKTPFELPRKNLDSLILENVTQIKTLTIPEIEKLSDILFNTCSRLNTNCSKIIRGCYIPRNAILFIDENNKTFEYIEICFECKTKETFGKIEHLDLSDYMYNDLEKFINGIGIKTKYISNSK